MLLKIKTFPELSLEELYEILRLRSEVFIVEQAGCYQDLDRIDYRSTHIYIAEQSGELAGCIRVFLKEDEPGTVQLGRLVVKNRMQGLGKQLMEAAEDIARKQYGAEKLFLTGRRSARGFYEKCGYCRQLPQGYTEQSAPYYLFSKQLIRDSSVLNPRSQTRSARRTADA